MVSRPQQYQGREAAVADLTDKGQVLSSPMGPAPNSESRRISR